MANPTTLPRTTALLLLLALLAATKLSAATAPAPAPPLPGEIYFKPPEFDAPAISPDGKNVAFIAQSNGHACLFRLDLQSGQISGIFSAGKGDVERFWWTGSQRVLLAGRGQSNLEYFVQDLGNSKPRSVDMLHNWSSDWIKILPNDPDHVVGYNKRFDLTTGRSSVLENASADITPVFSAEGETRAKLWDETGQWHIAWRARAGDRWQSLTCTDEDHPTFIPMAMAPDDHGILVIANDQGDTQALMRLDPVTGRRTIIAQRPKHDIWHLITIGPEQKPIGVEFCNFGAQDLLYFDEADQRFSAVLDQSLPGMIHRVTSTSADGAKRIIEAWFPGYPSRFYLFDNAQHRLSMLGEQRPDITAGVLGEVEYFRFKTRDGLEEIGHVLLPPTTRGPVPLIVTAINGVGDALASPSSYHSVDQFFASRGYAVAHIAVRGTPGLGQAFAKSGDFELAGKIVGDLEDGVGFLVKSGKVDPRRVAILGYELGALSALHTAAVSTAFHAVIAYDPDCKLSATSIKWLSTSRADTPTVVKQAGGTKAAYDLVHQFDPESFMARLSAPTLLANSASYGATYYHDGKLLQHSFDRNHKVYEWYELDLHDYEKVKTETYSARLYTKIADYLDQTLK